MVGFELLLLRFGEELLLFLGGVTSLDSGWPGRGLTLGVLLSLRSPRCTSSKCRRTLAFVAKVLKHTGQDFPVGVVRVLGRPPSSKNK